MRPLTLILAGLLLTVQVPLWFGERSLREVSDLERRLTVLRGANDGSSAINTRLEAELRDLANGRQAVEELARYELGLIGKDEIFVQINDQSDAPVKDDKLNDDRIRTASVDR